MYSSSDVYEEAKPVIPCRVSLQIAWCIQNLKTRKGTKDSAQIVRTCLPAANLPPVQIPTLGRPYPPISLSSLQYSIMTSIDHMYSIAVKQPSQNEHTVSMTAQIRRNDGLEFGPIRPSSISRGTRERVGTNFLKAP